MHKDDHADESVGFYICQSALKSFLFHSRLIWLNNRFNPLKNLQLTETK